MMVVRSVLTDAGIPFIVKGQGALPSEAAGSSSAFSDGRTVPGPAMILVPEEDLDDAREILLVNVYQPVSELRVKALEMKLLSGVIWAAVWFVLGFMIAYLVVPEDWDQLLRLSIYILAGLAAVTLGNAIQRSRRKTKDYENCPWLK